MSALSHVSKPEIVMRHEYSNGTTVSVIPYPSPVEDIDCFVVISWPKYRNDWGEVAVREARVSYVARAEDCAAEWMPPYGPISLLYRGDDPEAMGCRSAPYIYPLIQNRPMAWSQAAVGREGLLEYLADSNLDPVFRALAEWATRDD